jgi:chromosome segregation ATPase
MKTLASDLAQSRSDRESEKEKYEKEYANLQGQLDLREKAYAVLERELETRHSTQRSEVEEYEHRLNTVTQELESLRANEGFLEHKERQSNHEARTAAATADELRGETARLNKELSCTNEEVCRAMLHAFV